MYTSRKISLFHIPGLIKVTSILYRCGKDMAKRYGLHHWDNSYFKTAVIVLLCALKNRIYLVYDSDKQAVATFQVKKSENKLTFQKLATDPNFSGHGVGSFCMESIERMAKDSGLEKVCLEVYDQSAHAISFYQHRNYVICGTEKTLKYTELKMEKVL